MGLSGRKVKQRIGNDPRNLSWADDASRFGQSYLEKFGWDTSKGLGASGEGRTNAIKMSQKLDMLGIGMQRNQNDPNGIAWRQNRDFENLLQRLNEGTEAIGPFHKARESSPSEGEEVAAKAVDSVMCEGADTIKREKKKKKRKALQEDEEEVEGSAQDKRESKKRKKSKMDVRGAASPSPEAQAAAAPASESTPVPTAPIAAPTPVHALPRAHRARIIAAKRMAASNSAALAEILGIPSSSSTTATVTASPSPLTTATVTATTTPIPTLVNTSDACEEDSLQKLTTAAQSVDDYLRAKLGAKAAAQPWPNKNSTAPPPIRDAHRDRDDDDAPRAGLGAARLALTGPLDQPLYAASMFAAMFARGQASAANAKEEEIGAGETHEDEGDAGDGEDLSKSARRRAKEERRKKKEERRRRKEEEAKSRAIAEPDAEPPNDVPVVEPSFEARPAKRKKHHESGGLDGLLEDNPAPSDDRTVAVPNKMQKRDKIRKTGGMRTLDD